MANSNSQLLNYIGHLMSNDDALHHFLADPITNAEKAGLTKAERAVMRRVVTHLSNNALNGYSITRDPSSYRRSLRLLQNVLRHVGAKMLQDHQQMLGHVAPELVRSEADPTDSNTYTLEIYLPDTTGGEYYLKTNSDIGNAYAVPVGPFSVSMSSDSPTIYEVMEAAKSMYPGTFDFAYTADSNGNNSVSSFTMATLTPLTSTIPSTSTTTTPPSKTPTTVKAVTPFGSIRSMAKRDKRTATSTAPMLRPTKPNFLTATNCPPRRTTLSGS
ncbi:MAG: hypothetical protein AAF146_13375 [Bacteroidota bacterium]